MADDNTFPPVPAPDTITSPSSEQLEAWQSLDRYATSAGTSLDNVGTISAQVQNVFGSLSNSLNKAGFSLDSLSNSTSQAAQKTALLTTAFMGTRDAFMSISNVDTSRLVTATEQINDLQEAFKNSSAYKLAQKALDETTQSILRNSEKLGPSGVQAALKTAQDAFKAATTVITDTAIAFAKSADNAKRLQNSMIQMTVTGSGLSALLKSVGSDFQNIDKVNQKYADTLNKVTKELGGTKKAQELAASFMAIINQMPGGLQLLTEKAIVNGESFNMLSETLNIAAASGRKEEEVLNDINTVLRTYKSAIDDTADTAKAATDFTARMASVTSNLGANIKDVQSALMESADAFKMFSMNGSSATNMTKGMADSMENYVANLEKIGVPAANAIEMFKNYTNAVKNMSLGQMSFISTMSGGPGGLRGAFKMQDDISKGNFEDIRKQIEQTIKRQTGPIVSRDQAMQSEAAAAQYTRQLQMIQQGPLGSLAKTLPEAEAVLKSMKEGTKLPSATAKATDPITTMGDVIKSGNKIQKDSYNVLNDINTSISTLVVQTSLANRRTEKQTLGTGNPGSLGGGVGGAGGGVPVYTNGVNMPSSNELKRVGDVFADLPQAVKNAWGGFQDVIGTGNKVSIERANQNMLNAIKESKEQTGLTDSQKTALTVASQAFSATKTPQTTPAAPTTAPRTPAPTTTMAPSQPTVRPTFAPSPGTTTRPAQHMPPPLPPSNNTTQGAPGQRTAASGNLNVGAPNGQAVPVSLAPGSAITVNFTGACPHCGNNIRNSTNGVVSPQADHKH